MNTSLYTVRLNTSSHTHVWYMFFFWHKLQRLQEGGKIWLILGLAQWLHAGEEKWKFVLSNIQKPFCDISWHSILSNSSISQV